MLVTIHKCPKCEDVHINLQVYRFTETIYNGQYYVKCPKINKFFSIQRKEN